MRLLRPMVRWPSSHAEDDVGDEVAVFAEDDVGADGAVGADRAACGDLRASGDDGGGVDAHSAVSTGASTLAWIFLATRGTTWHMTVASQTSLPSTVMLPSILTARVRQLRTVDFDAELIAGRDGAAEAGVFDAGEDHELGVAVGDLGEEKSAAGLGDGFDHEDAGHDGIVGEVAWKN